VSVIWVASLLFLAAGAVLTTATLRKTAQATVDLRDECLQLDELRSALVELRQEADLTRAGIERIRSRSGRSSVDW
jgi:type II secretory pathway component PulJ